MSKKRILITGKGSYVGTSFMKWMEQWPDQYEADEISVRGTAWKEHDFSQYDVVLHVAAVVHQKERSDMRELYFRVNRDLPIEIARIAKESGVGQFIFMSTMAVYGEEGKIGQEVIINRSTPINPKTFYAASKIEAEVELSRLNNDKFRVVVLRPPIVYGPNCPGNYAKLEYFAIKSSIFPMIENKRSMLNIDKLCLSVKKYIDSECEGLYLPQDDEYINTSLMVKKIAEMNGKSIHLSKIAGWIIQLIGKKNNMVKKIFGNLVYEK